MAGSGGRVYGWLDDQRFDVIGALFGLVLALAMLPLRLIASNLFVLGIPVAIGIASALYLLAVRSDHETALPAVPIWAGRLLPSLTVLGMAAMVVVGTYQGGRTDAFLNLATIVGILLFYQIFFVDERDFHVGLVLVQVLAFAFVLRLVALRTMPGYVGIDVWTHVPTWSTQIMESGSLAPIDDSKYYASPLFHLLTVATSLFADVSIHSGLHLSSGIGMGLSALFIYVTARLFVPERWSLFATAVYAMSGYTIEWSIHLIPTSLGLIFFLGVFYLLARLLYLGADSREFLLIVLLSVATILTHQIASFIMLVLTGAGLVAHLLLRLDILSPSSRLYGVGSNRQDSVNLTGLLAFDVGFLTFMWSLTPYHGASFLETTFSYFRVALTESEGIGDLAGERTPDDAPALSATLLDQLVAYVDAIAFLSVFLLAVVGCLFVLRRRNLSHATFMFGVSIVVMCVFVFGFPIVGVNTFIPARWYAFMAAPMTVLAALGVAYLARNVHPTVVLVLLVAIALVVPVVAMASTSGTLDDPRFDEVQTRYSYTETELAAVDTVDEITVLGEDEQYFTDHPYNTVFSRTTDSPASAVNLSDDALESSGTVIYRDYQSVGAAFFVDEFDRAYQPAVANDDLCGTDRHHVYDNGDVETCLASWEIGDEPDTEDPGGDDGGGVG